MRSVNAPVPGRVERVIEDLRPALGALDTLRERRTLVVKRLGDGEPALGRIATRTRRALEDASPVGARLDGLDVFEEPVSGPGPVLYVRIESPGLRAIHDRLVDTFGAIEGLEGDAYVPHITIGRGGSPAAIGRIRSRSIPPISWTVERLVFWDASQGRVVGTISLTG